MMSSEKPPTRGLSTGIVLPVWNASHGFPIDRCIVGFNVRAFRLTHMGEHDEAAVATNPRNEFAY